MTRRTRTRRIRPAIFHPRCERLESRFVLSGIIFTEPASGTALLDSPESFRVMFDALLADYSVGPSDITLGRVGADGTEQPVFDELNLPFERLDETGTGLVFTFTHALEPGTYRLFLAGDTMLSTVDGDSLAPEDGIAHLIAEFTIDRPGVSLDDAHILDTMGPSPVTVSGALDFEWTPRQTHQGRSKSLAVSGDLNVESIPNDVALYQFTLAKGHFWRVGLEVSAERDGGNLNSVISLFDAQGRLLASNHVGRASHPFDPFLFAGLSAGTYYVDVSGSGNLPDIGGGYDPATGRPGISQDQPGGPITLRLVADEADLPGALTDFRVGHADRLDPSPSSIALQFSQALDLDVPGKDTDAADGHWIDVVDASGHVWPVVLTSYDPSRARIEFAFATKLPAGAYQVRLPEVGGLVDLAGHRPKNPSLPAGVLATFAVSPRTVPAAKDDLSTISLDPNISQTIQPSLAPSASESYRMIVAFPAFYQVQTQADNGKVDVTILNARGDAVASSETPGALVTTLAYLTPGEYTVVVRNLGNAHVVVDGDVRVTSYEWDSLLLNGVGQSSALDLRLVSYSTGASSSYDASPPSSRASGPASLPGGIAFGPLASDAPASFGFNSSATNGAQVSSSGTGGLASGSALGTSGPSSANFPQDDLSSLMGRPDRYADNVAFVGPLSTGVSVALGLPSQGRGARASLGRALVPVRGTPDDPMPSEADTVTDGSIANAKNPEPETPEVRPESRVTEIAEGVSPVETVAVADAAVELASEPEILEARSEPSEETEQAASVVSFQAVGIIAGACLAAQRIYRQWNARTRKRPTATANRMPGPHSMKPRVRV